MNITSQRIISLLMLTFIVQILLGCALTADLPENATPAPGMIESPNPYYAFAQATMDYGQSQLLDLSHKATVLSLDMSQAENAAAQATQEYNQRLKMNLDYQATIISLNITQAAATQNFFVQQTKMVSDATAVAQGSAAAATHSAYLVNVNQTVQAQALLDHQVLQTAQGMAAMTAYPLTTTPFAETQAALLMQQYDREQQAFVDQVITPMIPFLAALLVLLFILLVIVLAYQWFISMSGPRRLLRIPLLRVNTNPLKMIEGVIVDHEQLHGVIQSEQKPANPPELAIENKVHIEIVPATEPPVAHWVTEVEQQLATKEVFNFERQYRPAAEIVAQMFPGILIEQGLDPLISCFVLTETERGDAWLFVVMDDSVFEFLESYTAISVLSHLSASLDGHPVFFSNSYGLRYSVLLSPIRKSA